MQFEHIRVSLSPDEAKALKRMAEQDCRPAVWQVAWLIRQEAARRGLLELNTQERNDEAKQTID